MARKPKSLISIHNAVTKSNALVEASYKLSLTEQRILLTAVSLIQPGDDELKEYLIPTTDLFEILDLKSESRYTELKDTIKGLQRTFDVKIGEDLLQVPWITGAKYNRSKGTVTVTVHQWLRPYLLQLKSHFTTYRLKNVIKLRSTYAIRLYELLKQYEKIGGRKFLVEELRDILGIEESQYGLYADFKRKVIITSQKEINSKTDICFEYREIKAARGKVEAISFDIKANTDILPSPEDQIDLFACDYDVVQEESKPVLSLEERLARFGFKKHAIQVILKQYDEAYIKENLDIVEAAYQSGKVDNISAYASTALERDFRRIKTPIEEDNDLKQSKKSAEIQAIQEQQDKALAEAAATSMQEDISDPEFKNFYEQIIKVRRT